MAVSLFFSAIRPHPKSTLFPYTTLFRSTQQIATDFVIAEPVRGIGTRKRAIRVLVGRVGERHRSEEHTSELQSRFDLVCRLLLEKKKKRTVGECSSMTDGQTCPSSKENP